MPYSICQVPSSRLRAGRRRGIPGLPATGPAQVRLSSISLETGIWAPSSAHLPQELFSAARHPQVWRKPLQGLQSTEGTLVWLGAATSVPGGLHPVSAPGPRLPNIRLPSSSPSSRLKRTPRKCFLEAFISGPLHLKPPAFLGNDGLPLPSALPLWKVPLSPCAQPSTPSGLSPQPPLLRLG